MKIRTILLVLVASTLVLYGLWALSNARTFQLFGRIVSNVPVDDRVVALTFDDGPTEDYTEEVLSILRQHEVRATFFVTGREVEENPAAAKRIVAEGHELGNHSYSHQRLVFRSPNTVREEVERTDRAIRSTGFTGEILFRPPYGKKLLILPWYLQRTGRTTVTWDVEPESFADIAGDARKIADHVVENVEPGSVVLLHVMYGSRKTSREALPMIIAGLRAQGYEFVPLSELLERAGR